MRLQQLKQPRSCARRGPGGKRKTPKKSCVGRLRIHISGRAAVASWTTAETLSMARTAWSVTSARSHGLSLGIRAVGDGRVLNAPPGIVRSAGRIRTASAEGRGIGRTTGTTCRLENHGHPRNVLYFQRMGNRRRGRRKGSEVVRDIADLRRKELRRTMTVRRRRKKREPTDAPLLQGAPAGRRSLTCPPRLWPSVLLRVESCSQGGASGRSTACYRQLLTTQST